MVLVGAAAAVAALLPAVADSPPTNTPAATQPPDRTVVRVEHELVPVTGVEHELAGLSVIEEPGEKAPAVRRVPRRPRSHTRPDGFASRARQLLIGDGRYRPEPFPSVGR